MSEGKITEVNSTPETQSKDFLLYQNKTTGITIEVPNPPNIPLNEGLHIQISDGHDETDTPKETLRRLLFGLEAVKVTAESGLTPDAWANTRVEKGNQVSVYGRTATEKDSWRKPVDTNNRGVPALDNLSPFYDQGQLTKLFQRYTPKWETLLNNMILFDSGVNGKDIDLNGREGPIIWENERFNVEIIKNGHLNGFHMVVHPKAEFFTQGFKRQWQTVQETQSEVDEQKMVQIYIQATLEATAIAMGIQQLIAPGQGELHNSGNWAQGLKAKEGGTLNTDNLKGNSRGEKRRHRPDLVRKGEILTTGKAEDFGTGMHEHVYIPEKEGDPVILPLMWKGEAEYRLGKAKEKGEPTEELQQIIDSWNQIKPASDEQITFLKQKLGGNHLTQWLTDNCTGSLI